MNITYKELGEVLRAEARFINKIREQGMTPDDFSEEDYQKGILEEVTHPTDFNKLE